MALPQEKTYTIEDIYALPEGQRAELIDGKLYRLMFLKAQKIQTYFLSMMKYQFTFLMV